MRIAIFHLGFVYSGGGEKLVLEEIRGLKALGHDVVCYAPIVNQSACFPDLIQDVDVRALLPQPSPRLPCRDALWILLSCLLVPFMAWRFRSYDVFLGANQPAPWFAWVLAKLLRKPYVIYLAQPNRLLYPRRIDLEQGLRIREGDYLLLVALRRVAGRFIRWADRVSVRGARAMLTNGEYASSLIQTVYGRSNRVCPAGCHPLPEEALDYAGRWHGVTSLNGITVGKPYILLTNRHYPQKRFEYVIQALPSVCNEVPELSLVITGLETRYTDRLRALVESLGLESKVHFAGLVTETDLAHLYRDAALYAYPSPEEDFGMGIVEAMGAGTPVVAWNYGGPTVTVLDRVTGLLAKPWETSDYCDKLIRLATNPALAERLGRAGHGRAIALFSYQRHNQILEETLLTSVQAHRESLRSGGEWGPAAGESR